jgi:hypothetical protein
MLYCYFLFIFSTYLTHMKFTIKHNLLGSQATFSELQDCTRSDPDMLKLTPTHLEEIIAKVADARLGSPFDPPKFVLKTEMWNLYDPSFQGMSFKLHQKAMERRPKTDSPTAMTPSLYLAHPCFSHLASGILFEPILLNCIRDLMYTAAALKTAHVIYVFIR